MDTLKILPTTIKLMIFLVLLDVAATIAFFYFDILYDPDVTFSDIESVISFVFPVFYFIAMVWLIRTHAPITKIIFYVVFALESIAFIVDLDAASFDMFSMFSFVSIVALVGCINLMHSKTGKKWFEKN